MNFVNWKNIKILALVATCILFIIPYTNKSFSNNFILVLSGVALTIYIIAAVFEERKKTGHW